MRKEYFEYSEKELQNTQKLRIFFLNATELRKAMSAGILRAELGLDVSNRTAELLGASRSTIFRDRNKFSNQGESSKRSWGGHHRFPLSLEEEREFLAAWETEGVPRGVFFLCSSHTCALVKRMGYDIPPSTTYRILARHGWRKVQPDTKHPKSDQVAQDTSKKTTGDYGYRLFEKS